RERNEAPDFERRYSESNDRKSGSSGLFRGSGRRGASFGNVVATDDTDKGPADAFRGHRERNEAPDFERRYSESNDRKSGSSGLFRGSGRRGASFGNVVAIQYTGNFNARKYKTKRKFKKFCSTMQFDKPITTAKDKDFYQQ
ncbi:MAG: hypothetical protein PHS41_08805, partial [Victivallaceae bacterium]|nr:hypothetical protein [Victivallaceae bacterium]